MDSPPSSLSMATPPSTEHLSWAQDLGGSGAPLGAVVSPQPRCFEGRCRVHDTVDHTQLKNSEVTGRLRDCECQAGANERRTLRSVLLTGLDFDLSCPTTPPTLHPIPLMRNSRYVSLFAFALQVDQTAAGTSNKNTQCSFVALLLRCRMRSIDQCQLNAVF